MKEKGRAINKLEQNKSFINLYKKKKKEKKKGKEEKRKRKKKEIMSRYMEFLFFKCLQSPYS